MKAFFITLVLIGVSMPVNAKTKPTPKKPTAAPVTLKALIQSTLTKGSTLTLEAPIAESLNYASPPPAREYLINEPELDAQFSALVTFKGDGKTPSDLILSSTSVTEFNGDVPTAIDAYTYRADLTGKLISAYHAYGKSDAVTHDKLDVTSPELQARFNSTLKTARIKARLNPIK